MDEPELVAWLREQVAVDRRVADEVSKRATRLRPGETDDGLYVHDDDYRHDRIIIGCDEVLARCEAYTAILDLHREEPEGGFSWGRGDCAACSCRGALAATDCHYTVDWPCPTVRLAALAYQHRPGFREEWRQVEDL